jgi:hypothetical protein
MNKPATITIENLNIKLPPGFGRRADAIARGAARQLARLPVRDGVQLAGLTVQKITVQGGETDAVISKRIARAINREIQTGLRKGSRHAD